MSKKYSLIRLGEVAIFRNGLNFSSSSHGKGCLMIGVSDFGDHRKPHYASLGEINPNKIAKEDDYLKKGDVLFVRSNGNKNLVGRSLFIDKNVKALYSGFCIRARITSPKIVPAYFAYYTKSTTFKKYISSADGTNINNLNQGILSDVKIPEFPLDDQQKIVAVLSALDDKIELNNRINAELEQMGKALYDYWFVQFDFPDTNGKPYKSSGGKMVYNEVLKREIPDCWEKKKLSSFVNSINTGLNPRDHFKLGTGENYYITIKNIEYGRLVIDSSCDKISNEALARIQQRSNLEKGDILFTSIEPVGKTFLLLEKAKNWNINESVFNFKPNYNAVTSEYLFMLLSSEEVKLKCKNTSTGSIHKGIRITPLKEFEFAYPSKMIIDSFTKIIKPILEKINLVQQQNQQLSALRDWLLPMLMNGQVKAR